MRNRHIWGLKSITVLILGGWLGVNREKKKTSQNCVKLRCYKNDSPYSFFWICFLVRIQHQSWIHKHTVPAAILGMNRMLICSKRQDIQCFQGIKYKMAPVDETREIHRNQARNGSYDLQKCKYMIESQYFSSSHAWGMGPSDWFPRGYYINGYLGCMKCRVKLLLMTLLKLNINIWQALWLSFSITALGQFPKVKLSPKKNKTKKRPCLLITLIFQTPDWFY